MTEALIKSRYLPDLPQDDGGSTSALNINQCSTLDQGLTRGRHNEPY